MTVGIVVIGRNEGARLRPTLERVASLGLPAVYVDSDSSDESLELAEEVGVEGIAVDPAGGLSAARGRNVGFQHLRERRPDLELVQFVDGDCVLEPGWIDAARELLERDPNVTLVVGRLREQHPERSLWNRLCDVEWYDAPGPVEACGGIFLVRAAPFAAVEGFREDVVVGEERELCERLRAGGGTVLRVETPMAAHDADLRRFVDWWRRATRGGDATARGALDGDVGHRTAYRHRLRRTLAWGLGLPLLVVLPSLGALVSAWSLLLLSVPAALASRSVLRASGHARRSGATPVTGLAYGLACVAARTAECIGIVRYVRSRGRADRPRPIEYRPLAEGGD